MIWRTDVYSHCKFRAHDFPYKRKKCFINLESSLQRNFVQFKFVVMLYYCLTNKYMNFIRIGPLKEAKPKLTHVHLRT